jgi:hypothetical protein
MNPLTPGQDDPNWEEIIVELEAFCRSYMKGKPWFRHARKDVFLAGKSIKDYVYEAILTHLEEPEKFDPTKGKLIDFLKYWLLRNAVNADLGSKENETSRDPYDLVLQRDSEDESSSYDARLVPFTEALFDDEIDYGTIMADIEAAVNKDKTCGEIYYGQTMGMPRREIMKEFGMTAEEYVNGFRRLKTILNNIALLYDIEKPRRHEQKK